MKIIILFLLPFVILSCKDDPASSNEQQPIRNVKYVFSGSTSSTQQERVSYIIEHNGDLVSIEPNHVYPFITNSYELRKGDNVFIFAQNVSLVTNSTIRIDLIVDSDTVKTATKTGESPSTQISETLQ